MVILSKAATILSRPLVLGLLSFSIVSGTYIKGRIDGYHKAEIQIVRNENKDLKLSLENFRENINRDVDRLIEENKTFNNLADALANNTQEIIDAIPESDDSCNYPSGSATLLQQSLKEANATVFGEPSNGPANPSRAPRRE